jgi:P27 family predicted phage terminase small subunit
VRGRKPKPAVVRRLAGNPGHRPVNDAAPHLPAPTKMPRPPHYLCDEAAGIWRRLGRLLLDAGLLTLVDLHALAMFCAAAARWIEAEKKLADTGMILESKQGGLYQNPYLSVANKAWEQMRKMLSEFGLSPAERSRLRVLATEDEPSLAEQLFQMAGVDARQAQDEGEGDGGD